MAKRYFEFSEGSSNKFWEIWIDGNEVYTRYGKIGAAGSTTVKDQGSPAAAQKLHDKLVKEKTGKGYEEKTAAGADADDDSDGHSDALATADDDGDDADDGDTAAPAPAAAASGARRFEFSDDGSNKFWEIKVDGTTHTVTYGKLGTSGQSKTKDFGSAALAQKDADKLIAEKTKKGYTEV